MAAHERSTLRAGWNELGWGGHVAGVVVAGAIIVAVSLGTAIPRAAENHLLDGRRAALTAVADALADDTPGADATTAEIETFDQLVRHLLRGGETVGAKVWARDGTLLYATERSLIGTSADALPVRALEAFDGLGSTGVVSGDEHPELGASGRVIEFFFPVGEAAVVFEIEQLADSLEGEVSRISRTVWISIAVGIGTLVVVLVAAAFAIGRTTERRRRHTERLLRQALVAQETERSRIVAALHSDVGQRLYRVLYGLEGVRSRGLDSSASSAEIARLEDLVRDIDATLRSELRMLHRDAIQEIGFGPALRELTETTRIESGLSVDVDDALDVAPPAEISALLLWVAEEAIINARKHSGATRIAIRAWQDGTDALIEIVDDGSGNPGPRGIGLMTLTERLHLAGGDLVIESRRGMGTTLRAQVPHRRTP